MRKETRDDKNERIMKTETLGGDARIMKLNEVILRQITQKKIYNNTTCLLKGRKGSWEPAMMKMGH